jgi:hypothetical protein
MLVVHFFADYFRGPKQGTYEERQWIFQTNDPEIGHEWVDDMNRLTTPDFKIIDYTVAYIH